MRQLIEFVFEAADEQFSVVAYNQDDAFAHACAEADARGLHDASLRCVDYFPHDPSGGDGDDD